jgi:hypothetical protein
MNVRTAKWDDLNEYDKIQKHYLIALDSVEFINSIVSNGGNSDEDIDSIRRNVEHLKIMRAKDFWFGQDMSPIDAAILVGESHIQNEA